MRGIRGWIINLQDGLGPAPGSVAVSAKPESTNTELDLNTHGLGEWERIHLSGGSGSSVLADNIGHFGWNMELSPGPIDVRVTPSDPQIEYRRRFPDESSQVGKAFDTDLERVGWAGGRSGIVWNAVSNGFGVSPGGWTSQANLSWQQGNGSIASFGVGADAGRFVIRRFLSILGGVPFSVEMGDLMVPIAGVAAAPPNLTASDRWDVYSAVMIDDTASSSYGKQSWELTQGIPGAGIPSHQPETSTLRRLPFHALKMRAGESAYTDAIDLRQWLNAPGLVGYPWFNFTWSNNNLQSLGLGTTLETVDSVWTVVDFPLALTTSYLGTITHEMMVRFQGKDDGNNRQSQITCFLNGIDHLGQIVQPNLTADIITPGQDPPFIDYAFPFFDGFVAQDGPQVLKVTTTWTTVRIPSYMGTFISPVAGGRKWWKARIRFQISAQGYQYFRIRGQRVTGAFSAVP
jgi:hypothetical protein